MWGQGRDLPTPSQTEQLPRVQWGQAVGPHGVGVPGLSLNLPGLLGHGVLDTKVIQSGSYPPRALTHTETHRDTQTDTQSSGRPLPTPIAQTCPRATCARAVPKPTLLPPNSGHKAAPCQTSPQGQPGWGARPCPPSPCPPLSRSSNCCCIYPN